MFTHEGNHPARVLSVPPSPHLLFCLKSGTHRTPAHVLSSGWWARPQKPHVVQPDLRSPDPPRRPHVVQPDFRSPDPMECPARGEWVGAPPSLYLPVQQACAAYPRPPMRSAAHGLTTSSSPVPAATRPLGLAALLRDPRHQVFRAHSLPGWCSNVTSAERSTLPKAMAHSVPPAHCNLFFFTAFITWHYLYVIFFFSGFLHQYVRSRKYFVWLTAYSHHVHRSLARSHHSVYKCWMSEWLFWGPPLLKALG